MEPRNNFRGPRNIEGLDEQELIHRLHDQLSLIYHRVFLTGDWEGEFVGEKNEIRLNDFEDIHINDPAVLADSLDEFLTSMKSTLPIAVKPKEWVEPQGKHEVNRLAFVETIKYIRSILRQSLKDVGTREHIDTAKCIDENIHYFRDISVKNITGMKGVILESATEKDEKRIEEDAMRAEEGLRRINSRLSDIWESSGWRSSSSGLPKAA